MRPFQIQFLEYGESGTSLLAESTDLLLSLILLGTSHITLSSKSGTYSVCKDEPRVYICRVHGDVAVWSCGSNVTVISSANDLVASYVLLDGRIVVTRLSTNTTDFESQLVIQYMKQWNNTKIQCSLTGQHQQETLTYIIAGTT